MKRLVLILISILGLSVFAALPVGANVNNFKISNYHISYKLSRDKDNRSILHTTETITAEFPSFDQNRGIERAIPESYDDHPVDLKILSVKDEAGRNRQYQTMSQGGNLIIRIGNPDKYVHGKQVYKITYVQRDVTKVFSDTGSEFYWDTNGADWRVPIDKLSISLTVDESIASSISGRAACYVGAEGSSDRCDISKAGNQFVTQVSGLSPGENVTFAIGFQDETFAGYQMPLWQKLLFGWLVLQAIAFAASVGLVIWLVVRYSSVASRKSEMRPIAPEYLPPADSSVEVSAKLMGSHSSFAAQMIDFAVRHYIKIIETKPKGTFTPAEYDIEVVKPIDDLRTEEREVLRDILSGRVTPGSRLKLKDIRNNTLVHQSFLDNPKKLKQLIRGKYGLKVKGEEEAEWFRRFSGVVAIVSILLLSPILMIVALSAYVVSKNLWVLSDKGLALRRYLEGLKVYIKAAEVDRMRILQSPEGAEKVGDISDQGRLVRLYERLLPYAILFGAEKDWNRQLGRYYESMDTQPDWYVGSPGAVFSAAAFSGAISDFKLSTNYSSPSSSSSGGSSGGGFSGGGGGGGGGGGW